MTKDETIVEDDESFDREAALRLMAAAWSMYFDATPDEIFKAWEDGREPPSGGYLLIWKKIRPLVEDAIIESGSFS